MTKQLLKALSKVQYDTCDFNEAHELVWSKKNLADGVDYGLRSDGSIYVTNEGGTGIISFHDDMYIDDGVIAIAEKLGGHWEWENTGSISFCE